MQTSLPSECPRPSTRHRVKSADKCRVSQLHRCALAGIQASWEEGGSSPLSPELARMPSVGQYWRKGQVDGAVGIGVVRVPALYHMFLASPWQGLLITQHWPQEPGSPLRLSVPWWVCQRQPHPHFCPFYQIGSSRPGLLGRGQGFCGCPPYSRTLTL